MKQKTAIVLVNVGTPDAPTVKAVRKYLSEFLNDRRVIDLPLIPQKLLVNGIIVPFRAPKSARLYQRLWTEKGSPLLLYGLALRDKLQAKMGDDFSVFMAMRYGNPSLQSVLQQIKEQGFEKLVVLPLFPQYASSTTGTAMQAIYKEVKKWEVIPEIRIIKQFYNNEHFLNAFVRNIEKHGIENFDHVLFTYHGLPYRHIHKVHPEHACEGCSCDTAMTPFGASCYKATCYETSRLLAHKLKLPEDKYSVGFQSRLSKNWLHPFTDELILRKTKEGVKSLLLVAPSFVADCLETTIELDVEYKELFFEYGGEEFQMVASLNDGDDWVDAITHLVL